MKLSDLRNLSDSSLQSKLSFIANQVVSAPTQYGLTGPQGDDLAEIAALFSSALSEMEEVRGLFASAMESKENLREAALTRFGKLMNLMYAQPDVTPEAITSLTLRPRIKTKTPVVPIAPTHFSALPFSNGTVQLSWKPGGNKYGVVYEIEALDPDQENWTIIATTTKTRLTLSGFPAGSPKWFRVRATKNGRASSYSFKAGVYQGFGAFSVADAA